MAAAVRSALADDPADPVWTPSRLHRLADDAGRRAAERRQRPDAGQRAAFEDFVQRRGPALAALARGLTSSGADADDLLAEGLATMLERWERVAAEDDAHLHARRVLVAASRRRR